MLSTYVVELECQQGVSKRERDPVVVLTIART